MSQIILAVGTIKGAFLFTSDEARTSWTMSDPLLPGWEVSAIYVEPRKGGRIYAGTVHFAYGATIRVSDDMGANWRQIENGPRYAADRGFQTKRIWQITPHPTDPNTLYAGLDEAGIFVTHDRGENWSEIKSLSDQPNRKGWCPGAGGLCLHTIVIDPKNPNRMWVGISAVGVFRTTDAGESWQPANKGLPEFETGDKNFPLARCVHKIVMDPKNSDTLYMQFHGGVFKSTDAGDSWQAIESGLPGNFGFPMAVTSKGELFVAPLVDNEGRVMKDGKLRIYRSTNGGENWNPLENGFPREPQYVGVLRDALSADVLDPAGIYFGTSMGEMFASNNAGEYWQRLPGSFPRVEVVKAAVI
jgi:photosystem II stability/assembly factor-like uncharacterized protein